LVAHLKFDKYPLPDNQLAQLDVFFKQLPCIFLISQKEQPHALLLVKIHFPPA
jgi:hypothetical protein